MSYYDPDDPQNQPAPDEDPAPYRHHPGLKDSAPAEYFTERFDEEEEDESDLY